MSVTFGFIPWSNNFLANSKSPLIAAACKALSPLPFLSRYLAGPVAVALLWTLPAVPALPLIELVAAGKPELGPGERPPPGLVVESERER